MRIRIVHDKSTGFGSGTIIRSTPAESLILTSAHQFKPDKQGPLDEIPYRIKVDLFDGKLQESKPAQVHYLATVDGELVDCDFERDISLVRVRPGRRLPTSKVVPRRWKPRVHMKMLTVGCSEGRDATAWNTTITNPRVRDLAGNPDYQAIECQTAPKQGRTGGGLFTIDGCLAGVCDFAEPKGDHGLYATPDSIYRLLDRNQHAAREPWHAHQLPGDHDRVRKGQERAPRDPRQPEDDANGEQPAGYPITKQNRQSTFAPFVPEVASKEIDDLLLSAEEQLNNEEWVGLDRTILRLNAVIEERREVLREALRALDANDSRRRDQLLRRASEGRRGIHDEHSTTCPYCGSVVGTENTGHFTPVNNEAERTPRTHEIETTKPPNDQKRP